ncbi:MAG: hypothetical protein CMJ72_13520 [Planctomycetaceae bacterium]|nr:hypothetical protein [Planctomycetaceae bacterium]HCK40085.1 hypothetical protein [Planctomycetaceae bacterium]
MNFFRCFALALAWSFCSLSCQAAIVVAAADSLPEEKAKADLVCDGVDDQVELAASLAKARQGDTLIDINPKTQKKVRCALNHAVEWLPGNYHLSATLEVPDAANCVIRAEGTTLHYGPAEGDCVVIRGMNRCRYNFGTMETQSNGAALRIQPQESMPSLMSFVNFTGLIGQEQRGTGLMLDPKHENVCVNRITGTDILGFDKGAYVGSVGAREGTASTHGKCDTNWFWLSYIRLCNTCIEEGAQGVDDSVWHVNVDASVPGAVAIRTAAAYGKWYVIMGTYSFEKKNKALILEPGARNSVFEVHPPIQDFAWEDRSGSETNVILSSESPPYRPFAELQTVNP